MPRPGGSAKSTAVVVPVLQRTGDAPPAVLKLTIPHDEALPEPDALTLWDGTGAVVIHKKLDAGRFELPKPTCVGEQQVMVSDAIFDVIYKGVRVTPKAPRRRIH